MESIHNNPENSASSLTNNSYYQDLQARVSDNKNKGLWVKSSNTKGKADYYMDVTQLSEKSFFTTVKTHEKQIKLPLAIKVLKGEKLNIKDKVDHYMELYKKAVIDSKSHNLIMAKINGLKLASLSHILARIGVPETELRKLRKEAIEEASSENQELMKENIFNSELLDIVGGKGKSARNQKKILAEIETQVLTQAERLGIDGLYTKEKILELRIEAIQEIVAKFKAENQNLEYELEYLSVDS